MAPVDKAGGIYIPWVNISPGTNKDRVGNTKCLQLIKVR